MKNQKGITLIALIITIIVMLILVTVTVRVAVNSGLFGHTKNAVEQWKTEEDKELNLGKDNYINDTVNNHTSNNKPDRSHLKVGDYVAYTPDTADNYTNLGASATETENPSGSVDNPTDGIPQEADLGWRIMSINDDGTVDLISAKPTSTRVYFRNSIGFNNGVYLLNDLCKAQYSNAELGTTARSLDILDIESKFNSEGIAARDAYNNGNKTYGETQTYTGSNANTSDIYKHVGKTAIEESKDYYTAITTKTHTQEESLEVQQTFYRFDDTPTNYFDDAIFYELIFETGTSYWLASRYTYCYADYADFGLRAVAYDCLYGNHVFLSNAGTTNRDINFVRPVVSLGSNIQISATGGTADNPRTLSK